MKYVRALLLSLSLWGAVTAQAGDPEFVDAVEWMYANNLTRYASVDTFNPNAWLTREQAAKFYVEFNNYYQEDSHEGASEGKFLDDYMLDEEVEVLNNCNFMDGNTGDPTLKEYLVESCQQGLFKGSQGYFSPNEPLTKAQALTVLVRAMEGSLPEEVLPWWKNYHTRALALGLTKDWDTWLLDRPVSRYEMALLLYRAAEGGIDEEQLELNEILQILSEMGLRTK